MNTEPKECIVAIRRIHPYVETDDLDAARGLHGGVRIARRDAGFQPTSTTPPELSPNGRIGRGPRRQTVVERLIEDATERLDGLDVLVNNAATPTPVGAIADTDVWRRGMRR